MSEQNWWDDRTMPNDDGPDWERDGDGVLWQVDPTTGRRIRFSPSDAPIEMRHCDGCGEDYNAFEESHVGHSAEKDARPRRRQDERVMPSTGTFYVALPALDWGPDRRLVHPPEQVVQVSVINNLTVLTVCKYDEDGKTQTCTTEVEVVVDTNALLAALVSQLDPDVGQAALSMIRPIPPAEGSDR